MNRKLLLQSSLRIMLRNKLRTMFMSIGVMIGVGTLIAGQSLGSPTAQPAPMHAQSLNATCLRCAWLVSANKTSVLRSGISETSANSKPE